MPIWIDDAPAIAHNKVIILNDRIVLTGSFNFTQKPTRGTLKMSSC